VQGLWWALKWRCCAHKAGRTRGCEYPMVINREALEDKKLGNVEENYQPADVISDVIKIVNAILNSPKKNREFNDLVIEMGDDGHFLYYSEVWWISRERVMECGICDRNLCDLVDEKIIKLFTFAICFGLLD